MPGSENDAGRGIEDVWSYLGQRFGVGRIELEGFRIREVAGDFWLTSENLDTELEVETYGFRFVRTTGRGLKPTTYAIQFLGDRISESRVELDREEFLKLLKREEMVPRELDLEDGYVALEFDGEVV